MSQDTTLLPPSAAAEQAIRAVVTEAEEHQSDTERFLELHTDDAIIVNIAGRRVLGKDAIRQAMSQALATPLAKVITHNEVKDIRFPVPDVAIVSCMKHVSDERGASIRDGSTDPGIPSAGSLTYIMVNEADRWRIAAAQTTPLNVPG